MDCSSEKFNNGEVDFWEINFERLVSECKSKKVTQISEDVQLRAKLDGIYGRYYSKDSSLLEENNFELCNRLEQIITSQFCELDIYNELYLILQCVNGEKEKLFLDKWYLDKKSEKNTIPEFQKIKDNIKNLKKKDKENHIFSMEKYSTAKNAEIYSVGCNVVRIWLFSKKFRNLFIKTETRFEKYKNEDIEKIFEDCNELHLDYKTDDYIILEKLLGLNTDTYIRNFILSSIKEPNFEMLSPLIEC